MKRNPLKQEKNTWTIADSIMTYEFTLQTGTKRAPKLLPVSICRLSMGTGYSKGHISRVFSKRVSPSLNCVMTLAEELGISVDEFITRLEGKKFKVGRRSNE